MGLFSIMIIQNVMQAMGMAVMLDVIIDYVRSLQNQIEVS